MEHLFNCHGEWWILLSSLPVLGMAFVAIKTKLQKLRAWFVRVGVYFQLMWLNLRTRR